MYLTAIIDVYSRFIVGWYLYKTTWMPPIASLSSEMLLHCMEPLNINFDRSSQFTCLDWMAECAKHNEMKISMEGRGRVKDNIWIERFWKTIKYEYIYINLEDNGTELFNGIKRFIEDYNFNRRY